MAVKGQFVGKKSTLFKLPLPLMESEIAEALTICKKFGVHDLDTTSSKSRTELCIPSRNAQLRRALERHFDGIVNARPDAILKC